MSSKRMREEGEKSSSNWPDFTPHKKAIRNRAATEILAIIKMIITLIFGSIGGKSILSRYCNG